MASSTPLTAKALEQLGAQRLAELLLEVAERDAAIKRRLKLEIATPTKLATELRKRLAQIGRATTFLERNKLRPLAGDLEALRGSITKQVAENDSPAALELMWQFMDLANGVLGRCDDSDGVLHDIFCAACADLGPLAQLAKADPIALADRVFIAVDRNAYGQYGDLIESVAPALGGPGLDHLKQRFIAFAKTPVERTAHTQRRSAGWGSSDGLYEQEEEQRRRTSNARSALLAIADATHDVELYIAQFDDTEARRSEISAEIALRLLAVGRGAEALQVLDAAELRNPSRPDPDWEDARIQVLDGLGRSEDAQAARWACFARSLDARQLRAHLKRLPDFDDVEAERRALDHVEQFPRMIWALDFLIRWPALDRAAKLVLGRSRELNGEAYHVLAPAADALAGKHPLAATLLLRAMIDDTLQGSRTGRYRHAARHVLECGSLAAIIADFGEFEPHAAYLARLKFEHGRKASFWDLMS
ncbi:conserved protein of unknown function [Bradyrhizobium sp. ORS 285]|uniref:DUF6880 family protein n=1 Tax=Bradyrhizobium sp. ORS 285 TaxID=115808 RepID=UPI000240AC99|nr:DUF6880 family protein [Bradyrhizobium sp. ORS 285]CCD90023.1 conserved hypothetical protein [Bradyrhizobium sp. ORS 285]SMX61285.1 conserved protein of unknown function [Bradyrhizobium sp. ORS 285]